MLNVGLLRVFLVSRAKVAMVVIFTLVVVRGNANNKQTSNLLLIIREYGQFTNLRPL